MPNENELTNEFRIIGKKIREIRTEKGMTQEELAWQIGTSAQYLSKIENGKGLSLAAIIKISKALYIPPGMILDVVLEEDPEFDTELHWLFSDCKNVYEKRLIAEVSKNCLRMAREAVIQLQSKS